MTDEAKRCVEALRWAIAHADCTDKDCTCPVVHECEHSSFIYCDSAVAADLIESLSAELKQVKRERDAAVEDLEMLAECETCIHDDDEACDHCCDVTTRGNWQWRGVKESSDA